jgi:hypothetical protein
MKPNFLATTANAFPSCGAATSITTAATIPTNPLTSAGTRTVPPAGEDVQVRLMRFVVFYLSFFVINSNPNPKKLNLIRFYLFLRCKRLLQN